MLAVCCQTCFSASRAFSVHACVRRCCHQSLAPAARSQWLRVLSRLQGPCGQHERTAAHHACWGRGRRLSFGPAQRLRSVSQFLQHSAPAGQTLRCSTEKSMHAHMASSSRHMRPCSCILLCNPVLQPWLPPQPCSPCQASCTRAQWPLHAYAASSNAPPLARLGVCGFLLCCPGCHLSLAFSARLLAWGLSSRRWRCLWSCSSWRAAACTMLSPISMFPWMAGCASTDARSLPSGMQDLCA